MLLSHRAQKLSFDPKKETRARKRRHVWVRGAIFFPERQYEEECFVSDLSPEGAGLKSSCSAALGSRVVLYIDGLGRFEGKIAQRDRLRVGVQFKCSEAKRDRIDQLIAAYAELGSVSSTTLRDRNRLSGVAALHSFIRSSGQKQACEIVDMALSGASLRTDERPDLGETIFFGKTAALVVRHTECGIAVTFTSASAPKPVNSAADLVPVA